MAHFYRPYISLHHLSGEAGRCRALPPPTPAHHAFGSFIPASKMARDCDAVMRVSTPGVVFGGCEFGGLLSVPLSERYGDSGGMSLRRDGCDWRSVDTFSDILLR